MVNLRCALYDIPIVELPARLVAIGIKGFKSNEVVKWCYERKVASFAEMTTLSLTEREILAGNFILTTLSIEQEHRSPDATRKFLLRLSDGKCVESVLIPESDRTTLCVSTQVGCPVRCAFCASGLYGLQRNLTCGEIVGQFMAAARASTTRLSNVVIMGMGEPFYNFEAVMQAIGLWHTAPGLEIGLRKITLSTIGVAGLLDKIFSAPWQPKLAISLHAPSDDLRRVIIPHDHALGVREIIAFIRRYNSEIGQRVTVEYVLLDKLNASAAEAHALARLLRGLDIKVNLIPLNPVAEISYAAPSPTAIARFADILSQYGITNMIRAQRGDHISAACGQLRLNSI
jgi:23S rRNA (adenine2503-C2)-methyltransferase